MISTKHANTGKMEGGRNKKTIQREKSERKRSNERGITLSSIYRKLYERMMNERVLKEINISDEQAGGKKRKCNS